MKTLLLCVALSLAGAAFAQNVAPPPRPADNGPSLAATMQFIQEQLSSTGTLNYIAYRHDNKIGTDWTNTFADSVTNVRANVATCRIDYHFHVTRDGQVVADADPGILLKDVTEVAVKTRDQDLKEADAKSAHPEYSSRVDPPVFVLEVKRKIGVNDFNLYDESLANRIAKALVHAVELCGGGNKDPF